MRLAAIVSFAAVALALVGTHTTLLQTSRADTRTSAITACAVQGEDCSLFSLDSPPGSVLGHTVLGGACARPGARPGDLHVMRYIGETAAAGAAPLVATWCT